MVGDPTATVQTPGRIGLPQETFLPSDLDGIIPPPAGRPQPFRTIYSREESTRSTPSAHYTRYGPFMLTGTNPANSSFTLEASVPAAGFTSLCPTYDRDCVPQKGTSTSWTASADRLMFRNAYRRFPDGRESLLNNLYGQREFGGRHTLVRAATHTAGNWAIRQENTYQPDNTWRWMGSIASDNQGNIALGFSASSAKINPQIRYAGRLATDPLSILSGEQHLFDGTGARRDDRWGDYSDMTVDPVDDCTFYYTNEYYEDTTRETTTGARGSAISDLPSAHRRKKGLAHFVVRLVL